MIPTQNITLNNNRMNRNFIVTIVLLSLILTAACRSGQKPGKLSDSIDSFPKEMVSFAPYEHNPVFRGTGEDTWDKLIRERGFIMKDDGIYKMWYTGYNGPDTVIKYLGYATSPDGIKWTRYEGNPAFTGRWTEDMFVFRAENKYYMYAEGRKDIAHLLISDDGVSWADKGDLKIIAANGDTIPGPYGTPSVLIENGKWYLFYERDDEGVWIAVSDDHITWKNIQDEPVLKKGPEDYDSGAVASNQVLKYRNRYFMFYHGTTNTEWANPGSSSIWTSNVAMSADFIHWIKYPKNPVVEGDHSSPIIVFDGEKYRLYAMHPEVWLYFSASGR